MKLTREERARILAGDASALKRKEKPDVEEGEEYVLIWSPARTVVTDRRTGETADYPRRPLLWVEFAKPKRHRDGTHRVSMTVHDERPKTRFLGPAAAPSEDLDEETARGYRATRRGAIDDAEGVDDTDLAGQKVEADRRRAVFLEEHAVKDLAGRQERALREQLKRAVRQLPLEAGRALLAKVEMEIHRALENASDDERN